MRGDAADKERAEGGAEGGGKGGMGNGADIEKVHDAEKRDPGEGWAPTWPHPPRRLGKPSAERKSDEQNSNNSDFPRLLLQLHASRRQNEMSRRRTTCLDTTHTS